jgi:endonuclease-3
MTVATLEAVFEYVHSVSYPIQSVVSQKATMAVDTHVFRVSNRLGLTNNSKTPYATEMELTKTFQTNLFPSPITGSYCTDDIPVLPAIQNATNAD